MSKAPRLRISKKLAAGGQISTRYIRGPQWGGAWRWHLQHTAQQAPALSTCALALSSQPFAEGHSVLTCILYSARCTQHRLLIKLAIKQRGVASGSRALGCTAHDTTRPPGYICDGSGPRRAQRGVAVQSAWCSASTWRSAQRMAQRARCRAWRIVWRRSWRMVWVNLR